VTYVAGLTCIRVKRSDLKFKLTRHEQTTTLSGGVHPLHRARTRLKHDNRTLISAIIGDRIVKSIDQIIKVNWDTIVPLISSAFQRYVPIDRSVASLQDGRCSILAADDSSETNIYICVYKINKEMGKIPQVFPPFRKVPPRY